jgi:hypothetical protein
MTKESAVKEAIRQLPLIGPTLVAATRAVRRQAFPGSTSYWERHYQAGGGSGEGSAGQLAEFKAGFLNDLVTVDRIDSVIEFGCGDGEQLGRARYPKYLGLDVSATTLRRTMRKFADDSSRSFLLYDPYCFTDPANLISADLAVSLDVIYHLVEDEIYQLHLRHLFGAASRFVCLFTSDADTLRVTEATAPHVRHRPVVRDVATMFPQWRLVRRVENPFPHRPGISGTSFADFFVYERSVKASGVPSSD